MVHLDEIDWGECEIGKELASIVLFDTDDDEEASRCSVTMKKSRQCP